MPAGLCETLHDDTDSITVVYQVSGTDEEIVNQLKTPLEMKDLQQLNLTLFSLKLSSRISSVNLRVSKNIVIYGFQFHAIEYAKQRNSIQALPKSNDYSDKFTLKFLKGGICEAEFKFDGKLTYDNRFNFFFSKPFLARKNSNHIIQLEFHHKVVKNCPCYFSGEAGKLNDEFTVTSSFNIACLSQILYKIV
jgi:hypothetical protein